MDESKDMIGGNSAQESGCLASIIFVIIVLCFAIAITLSLKFLNII